MELNKVVYLSQILFCIYIDNLLMSLKKNNIGCHVGSHFCGAFGYADDIMLLSPSVTGLQNMSSRRHNLPSKVGLSNKQTPRNVYMWMQQ